MKPIRAGSHTLSDGRRLRWAQWGAAGGQPILFFHGTPSSRLDHFDQGVLEELGVELTTVDRPGVGGSTPKPGRRVIDWPDDVSELAEAFDLDRFITVGHSMGGSYALACAVRLADRVEQVGLVASIAPWTEPGFADVVPPYVQPIRDSYERDPEAGVREFRGSIHELREAVLADAETTVKHFASGTLSETDQALFRADRDLWEAVKLNFREHLVAGIEGMLSERMAGHICEWGFHLVDVTTPVRVIQGADDLLLPPTVGRLLAERLPNATYHEFEGVGHFFPTDRHKELLRLLIGKP